MPDSLSETWLNRLKQIEVSTYFWEWESERVSWYLASCGLLWSTRVSVSKITQFLQGTFRPGEEWPFTSFTYGSSALTFTASKNTKSVIDWHSTSTTTTTQLLLKYFVWQGSTPLSFWVPFLFTFSMSVRSSTFQGLSGRSTLFSLFTCLPLHIFWLLAKYLTTPVECTALNYFFGALPLPFLEWTSLLFGWLISGSPLLLLCEM